MGALDCVTTGKMQPTDSTEVFAISMSSNSTLSEPRTDLESQTTKGTGRRHSIWWTILIDIPLILIVVGLIGFFELGFLPSNPAGFFCGDPALSFQYTGDTVTTATLTSLVFLAPIVVVPIIEAIFTDSEGHQARFKEAGKNTLWVYRSYLYGLIFNFAVIEVMKGVTGSPRPTFFDMCEPDTALTCNGLEYVKSFKCTSTRFSQWKQRDASHSFPSGHTSLSVYCGVFIAWYLQKRAFDWRYRTVFVVPVIQLSCFLFAAISSLTRITDHRHHWWDVLAGFVIGIITFLYAAVVLCKNFSPLNNKKSQKSESPENSQSSDRTLIYDTERSNGLPL